MDAHMFLGLVAVNFGMLGLGFFLGWMYGETRTKHWWQNEMIRRRHAVYHWENAKWYWIEDEPDTPRDPASAKAQQLMQAKAQMSLNAARPAA